MWKRHASPADSRDRSKTATTAMADIEDTFELVEQSLVVIEVVGPPVERMTCGSLEAAFSLGHGTSAGPCGPAIPVRF